MSGVKTYGPPQDMYSGADYPTIQAPEYGAGSAMPMAEPQSESRNLLHGNKESGGLHKFSQRAFRLGKKLLYLRLAFKFIGAIFSIITAALEIKTYLEYWNSRDLPDRWPDNPFTGPTLLMIGVGIAGAFFDVLLLLAHLFRGRFMIWAATSAVWVIGGAKAMAYLITVVSNRADYSYGIDSGNSNDLWGYTCSRDPTRYAYPDEAQSACSQQNWAWYLSIGNISVESLGLVGESVISWIIGTGVELVMKAVFTGATGGWS